MIVKKYVASTREEAEQQIKKDLGPKALVLVCQEQKGGGFRLIAGVEEKGQPAPTPLPEKPPEPKLFNDKQKPTVEDFVRLCQGLLAHLSDGERG